MNAMDVLGDAYGRLASSVHRTLEGLGEAALTARLDEGANSIAWLIWHLSRVQDDHVTDVAGGEQIWTAGGFVERFALPFDRSATGYGHGPIEVAQVTASAGDLASYFDAVHARSQDYLATLSEADLDRVVDTGWDPPVTLGVRLVSVVNDGLQHVGQAAFIRGVLDRS